MEFAIYAILILLAIAIFAMCATVIMLAYTTHGHFRPKKFKNNGVMHRIYTGINTDVVVVTFRSSFNRFGLCDSFYWIVKRGVDKIYAIDRMIYLDLDTNEIYRPNHGKFDVTSNFNVDITKLDDDTITGIEIYDDHRHVVDYKFEYKEIL